MAFGDLIKGAGDMLNKVKDSIEEATGVDLDNIADTVADKLEGAKDFVAEKVGDAKDFVTEKAIDAKDFVAEKASDVSEAVSHSDEYLEKAKGMVSGAKDAVVGKIKDLTDGDEKVA